MKNPNTPVPPPMLLAIAYAPVPVRARLKWLLMLDQRLLDVLNRASEPMIAQLRLSWWRDALKSAPDRRPKGEPLLMELNDIEPDEAILVAGLSLIDACEVLATDTDCQERSDARKRRILAICEAYRTWNGYADFGDSQIDLIVNWWTKPAGPALPSFPRLFRPLTILALAERLETSQNQRLPLRLNWHALTGR
jgi:hypothetical protein